MRNKDNSIETFQLKSKKIVDSVQSQLHDRFSEHIEKIQFTDLLNPNKFGAFRSYFPDLQFQTLKLSYGSFFDFLSEKRAYNIVLNS